jgi:hypothetical protein
MQGAMSSAPGPTAEVAKILSGQKGARGRALDLVEMTNELHALVRANYSRQHRLLLRPVVERLATCRALIERSEPLLARAIDRWEACHEKLSIPGSPADPRIAGFAVDQRVVPKETAYFCALRQLPSLWAQLAGTTQLAFRGLVVEVHLLRALKGLVAVLDAALLGRHDFDWANQELSRAGSALNEARPLAMDVARRVRKVLQHAMRDVPPLRRLAEDINARLGPDSVVRHVRVDHAIRPVARIALELLKSAPAAIGAYSEGLGLMRAIANRPQHAPSPPVPSFPRPAVRLGDAWSNACGAARSAWSTFIEPLKDGWQVFGDGLRFGWRRFSAGWPALRASLATVSAGDLVALAGQP